MRVKICGITRLSDALTAVKYGADAIGFIFYKKSKRYITPKDAEKIISKLPFFVHKIGVFVDEEIDYINSLSEKIGLTGIQLHGFETPEFVSKVKLPVVKAFRINSSFNYDILYRYKKTSFLLDSFDENEFGGTGKTFDWSTISDDLQSKIILAGGVNESNIELIKNKINPQAIDVSSSIEDEPGIKNKLKMIKLLKKINEVRNVLC